MSAAALTQITALQLAQSVRRREVSASEVVRASLVWIERTDSRINAFTDVTAQRAQQRAKAIDSALARSPASAESLPLAGVPFAVKNLFDVAGLATRAGSRIERERAPAAADALLVSRMENAGAILVGALNMDEYAYGFTTENSHYGPTRNPHDLSRIAGGSSGGSAAAVVAGQVPVSLGSDTNGSVRVPASLCGAFGLKPTYGRLPRTGTYPFVASLDHLGPFARTAADLACVYDALQGPDPGDPACAQRPAEPVVPTLADGCNDLRIAVLGGYFDQYAGPQACAAVAAVAAALGTLQRIELPRVAEARAAAFLITNAEAGALHLPDLRSRAADFEPLSRDRFLAGALLPAAWIDRAQRVRRAFACDVAAIFSDVDILLAPATPVAATPIGTDWIDVNGERLAARPGMGILTQPVSCIGLPVCCVPVWLPEFPLPIGVQIIAAPWREDRVMRVAAALEKTGVVSARLASPSPAFSEAA